MLEMNSNDDHLIQRANDYSTFFVKSEEKFFPLKIEDINWVSAKGNYCTIFTEKETEFVVRISLTKIKVFLISGNFSQINKKDLVNCAKIKVYDPKGSITIQNQTFPVSRRFKKSLEDCLTFLP